MAFRMPVTNSSSPSDTGLVTVRDRQAQTASYLDFNINVKWLQQE